ncbi:MAG: putative phage cell wall peptidase NlpC/P60 family [Rickettsiales bacterium]|jgi:NlpC/P60 family putative phage cell wall peptidase|nr:putative phage cell wall peptidase NlpC/P60 family [Rickettsiales bacterium]
MSLQTHITAEAREWIGTRFHHQGRCKRTSAHSGGCDCIGLIVGVLKNLGMTVDVGGVKIPLHTFDRTDYSMLPDGKQLEAALLKYLNPIPNSAIEPADILLFRFDKNPQHVAFAGDYRDGGGLSLIHCYRSAGAVVEHRFDETWQERLVAAFRIRP